ncbi:hypothetical protein EYC80_004918 [Monilinia laxa]|uniref:Ubiquitin 3 binding protein But2 C-terminal domain-containing protein n=1 Tax=Monilinia laxa TaxID=61186 RepID=A0A5N6KIA4_MONLA|nr:hypothetical protein EYC80_004918 [Monilinia laxa]
MLFTISRFAFVAAIGLTSAAPTPVSDSSDASASTVASDNIATAWPTVLEEIWEEKPQNIAFNTLPKDDSDPSQGNFGIGATWNGSKWTSRQYTYASFDIPADAQICALWSSFPTSQFDYEALIGLPNLEPQVEVFSPKKAIAPDDLTFWDVFPVDSAPNVDEFASTQLNAGGDTHLGDFPCSPGSTAEFIIGIAGSTVPDAQEPVLIFRLNNTAPRDYGLYITYGNDVDLSKD